MKLLALLIVIRQPQVSPPQFLQNHTLNLLLSFAEPERHKEVHIVRQLFRHLVHTLLQPRHTQHRTPERAPLRTEASGVARELRY